IALITGTSSRSRASLALRLRSPRDTPLPLATNVLLLRWDTKPAAHQEDVPTPGHDTQNVFLCRTAVRVRYAAYLRCSGLNISGRLGLRDPTRAGVGFRGSGQWWNKVITSASATTAPEARATGPEACGPSVHSAVTQAPTLIA